MAEKNKRTGSEVSFTEDVIELIRQLTEPFRYKVEAKYLARRRTFEKAKVPGRDDSTVDAILMSEFDAQWRDDARRRLLVPGKETLADINGYLQEKYGVTISPSLIVECFKTEEVEGEMRLLIETLEDFRQQPVDQSKGSDS